MKMKIINKAISITAAAVLACSLFTACADKNMKAHSVEEEPTTYDKEYYEKLLKNASQAAEESGASASDEEVQSIKVQFDISIGGQSAGSFVITTDPSNAPETCKNFEKLVREGFYDGLTFHRVVDDFMAQGGDPKGDGTGGSSETVKGEFSGNGVNNQHSHTRGTVSMARSQDPNSASSLFFICYTDCSFLDGQYAAFGDVTEGMDVIDSFLKVERTANADGEMAVPKDPIVIEKAVIVE